MKTSPLSAPQTLSTVAPMTKADFRGVIVLASDGTPKFASAHAAADEKLIAKVARRWDIARGEGSRVFTLGAENDALVVIAMPSGDDWVLTLLAREARDPLFEFVATVDFAGDILRLLLTNPFEALTVVDREGMVRYISPIHERFFGISPGSGIGRHVTKVIENTRLHEVARSGKAEIGQVQEMKGTRRIVNRMPVTNQAGNVVGAVGQVMFKDAEQLRAMSAELTQLRSQVAFYKRELNTARTRTYGIDHIVGESAAIRRLKQQIIKIAPMDVPVLVVGESGTGKELVAHAIHMLSPRRDNQMVMINAAALPATLIESELFGYEAGAFTGAERKGRRGKIEQADQSTLFFDEIGDMPLEMQVKLLRVLQDGSFERVGGDQPKASNFRLISASNRDFSRMIDEGTFRLDLFYRIGAVTISVPPLRERLEDIPLLAEKALREFAAKNGGAPKQLSAAALQYLQGQSWPGNVRQLMHVIARAAIFAERATIEPEDFGMQPAAVAPLSAVPLDLPVHADPAAPASGLVREAVEKVEGELIRSMVMRCNGNKKRAAAELGISRSYLYKRLAELGIK